jgi:hypothetical protein
MHALPQAPQLAGSFPVSTQVSPHWASGAHDIAHAPAAQTSPAAQAFPHAPQFFASERRSTHASPQATTRPIQLAAPPVPLEEVDEVEELDEVVAAPPLPPWLFPPAPPVAVVAGPPPQPGAASAAKQAKSEAPRNLKLKDSKEDMLDTSLRRGRPREAPPAGSWVRASKLNRVSKRR